jgi:hypothetical protein
MVAKRVRRHAMSNSDAGEGSGARGEREQYRWSLRYLKDVGVVYQRMWMDQITTWDAALKKAESGTYTAGQWVGDVVGLSQRWFRNLWLLGFPFQRWMQQGDQIPSVAFVVDAVAEGADAKEVLLPVGASPEMTTEPQGITPSTGQPLTANHIVSQITPDGTHLSVGLRNLQNPSIDPGHYRCLICVYDETKWVPLAAVHVLKLTP